MFLFKHNKSNFIKLVLIIFKMLNPGTCTIKNYRFVMYGKWILHNSKEVFMVLSPAWTEKQRE